MSHQQDYMKAITKLAETGEYTDILMGRLSDNDAFALARLAQTDETFKANILNSNCSGMVDTLLISAAQGDMESALA